MKIKEQTRRLAAGCSKQCFEVVDRTDEVSNHTYGKATLTWFEFDFRRVLGANLGQNKEKSLTKGFLRMFTSTLRESNPHLKNRNLT